MHPIVCIPLLLSWSVNFTNFTNHIIKCHHLPIHYSHTCHIGKKREGGGGGRHLPSTPDIERTKHAVRIHWQTWEKVALRMRPVFLMFITRYATFICLFILLIPSIFVLASKRNNYTDSEMDTLFFISSPWSPVFSSWYAIEKNHEEKKKKGKIPYIKFCRNCR